jgi:hypothetical protein
MPVLSDSRFECSPEPFAPYSAQRKRRIDAGRSAGSTFMIHGGLDPLVGCCELRLAG